MKPTATGRLRSGEWAVAPEYRTASSKRRGFSALLLWALRGVPRRSRRGAQSCREGERLSGRPGGSHQRRRQPCGGTTRALPAAPLATPSVGPRERPLRRRHGTDSRRPFDGRGGPSRETTGTVGRNDGRRRLGRALSSGATTQGVAANGWPRPRERRSPSPGPPRPSLETAGVVPRSGPGRLSERPAWSYEATSIVGRDDAHRRAGGWGPSRGTLRVVPGNDPRRRSDDRYRRRKRPAGLAKRPVATLGTMELVAPESHPSPKQRPPSSSPGQAPPVTYPGQPDTPRTRPAASPAVMIPSWFASSPWFCR